MPLGLYISVPFCRTKCSYCNFASDVFSRAIFERYVDRVCVEITQAAKIAEQMGGHFERTVDSVYLGGGTPTILDINQLQRLFVTISQNFEVLPQAEVTVECAPGTLTPPMIVALRECGVNRVSLGVQSFIDREAASVGRLHKRQTTLDDIANLRASGIANINVDLIAGLPHQTSESWKTSLAEAIDCGAPHVSVYMLEVDEDSRLGRELIAGGTKYHAHFVPEEDLVADFYIDACERLEVAGIRQYEISNFAREGGESRHNLKYWTRQPYMGFGVDAHSMLESSRIHSSPRGIEAVRFSTPESLEVYVAAKPLTITPVSRASALEEVFFLGLRLNKGVDLNGITQKFGEATLVFSSTIQEHIKNGLLEQIDSNVRLTLQGRLLSNEVFQSFISSGEVAH